MLFTMLFGTAFIVLHGMEWSRLIESGMTPFKNPWAPNVPQFGGTFYTLTGMHMLHVTIGVIYLGVVSLRKKFLPILLVLWLAAWLGTPADSVFHIGAHALLIGAIVSAVILFLKPKDYDAHDVEIAGLYWHFVDLVWMFIFPLVYLMSTRV
jgi:cytochrome c oxidase subunit 3